MAESNIHHVVKLKKVISLWNAIGIIITTICLSGSGIFVTPKTVLMYSGSTGMSLVMWAVTGVVSTIGALCYAELALIFPESGSDYTYLRESFGPLFGFLFIWVVGILGDSATRAAGAMTFSTYLTELFWPCCSDDPNKALVTKLIAIMAIMTITAINCYRMKYVVSLNNLFSSLKILTLVVIVITGIVRFAQGLSDKFINVFEGATESPVNYVFAFYACYWAYSGFNALGYVVEEICEPLHRNVTMSMIISISAITFLYVLTNLIFIMELSPTEILSTNAVVVTYGSKISNFLFYLFPILVTFSSCGALNVGALSSSRLFMVAARQGHLPRMFLLLSEKQLTPIPALVSFCLLLFLVIGTNSIDGLIIYSSYFYAVTTALTISALIYLRLKRKDLHNPLELPLVLPISFLIFFIIVLVLPFVDPAQHLGIGMSFLLSVLGVPVYLVCIFWKSKPIFLSSLNTQVEHFCQKLFLVFPEGEVINPSDYNASN